MAWVTPTTRAAGYVVPYTVWNSDCVDNPIALRAGAIAIASQAAGDVIYASSSTQFGRLAIGASGTVLLSNGTAPTWTSNFGTPSALVLTNATGLPATGVTGTAAILGANTFNGKQTVSFAGGTDFVATLTNTTAATAYGLQIKEPAAAVSGFPSLLVSNSAGTSEWFRVDTGGASTFGGPVSITNAAATNELMFTGTDSTNILSATTGTMQIGTTAAGTLTFLTNNTLALTISTAQAATFVSTARATSFLAGGDGSFQVERVSGTVIGRVARSGAVLGTAANDMAVWAVSGAAINFYPNDVTSPTLSLSGSSTAATFAGSVTANGAFTSSVSVALTGTTNNLGTITTGVWNGTAIANAYVATGLDVAKLTTGTTLPSNVVTSSLTAVGTIATGVWNAGAVTSSGAGSFTTVAASASGSIFTADFKVRGAEGGAATLYLWADEGDDTDDQWSFTASASGGLTIACASAAASTITLSGENVAMAGLSALNGEDYDTAAISAQVVTMTSSANVTVSGDTTVTTGTSSPATVYRITTADTTPAIVGIEFTTAGKTVYVVNTTSTAVALKHNVTATAANRLLLPDAADWSLGENEGLWFWYDTGSARWRAIGVK